MQGKNSGYCFEIKVKPVFLLKFIYFCLKLIFFMILDRFDVSILKINI